MTRTLIVNADDLGRSPGINEGVVEAFERGIVTSASLMARWPAAAPAAKLAHERPALSVGLHVDLAEWTLRHGAWRPVYERVPVDDAGAVAKEVDSQLELFHALIGQEPSHLDSHQHVHHSLVVGSILRDRAARLGVPLRGENRGIRYCGAFYGQLETGEPYLEGITVDGLLETLARLTDGVTELGCHPALRVDFDSSYGIERLQELRSLCDPRVQTCIREFGLELRSFHDLSSRELRMELPS
jgi:predicted glycoside hydrolase/deacetylase ChbG (UPF0249 family)